VFPFPACGVLYTRWRLRYRGRLQTETDSKEQRRLFQLFFAMDPTRIDIETLLPHRGRMKLVEEIVALDEDHAVAHAEVRPGWPLCDGRFASAVVLIELVAQAAGLNNGWVRIRKHGHAVDRRGWIVGLSEAALHVDRLAVGTRITVRAENRYAFEGFREVHGQVEIGGKVVAEATLMLLRSGSDDEQRKRKGES
jgi:predicted hotdog family 3-hydroxylacyl-ACP dehydratase